MRALTSSVFFLDVVTDSYIVKSHGELILTVTIELLLERCILILRELK